MARVWAQQAAIWLVTAAALAAPVAVFYARLRRPAAAILWTETLCLPAQIWALAVARPLLLTHRSWAGWATAGCAAALTAVFAAAAWTQLRRHDPFWR